MRCWHEKATEPDLLRCSQMYLCHITCLHRQALWQVLLSPFCKLSDSYREWDRLSYWKDRLWRDFFFTHSASEPSRLLNRRTHITANCLIAMVSSGDLGDLPSNQTLPESDSGMFTFLSDGWAGDYSGVKDWPLRGWICSIVYSWTNTHQAKKKDSLSLSG